MNEYRYVFVKKNNADNLKVITSFQNFMIL